MPGFLAIKNAQDGQAFLYFLTIPDLTDDYVRIISFSRLSFQGANLICEGKNWIQAIRGLVLFQSPTNNCQNRRQ